MILEALDETGTLKREDGRARYLLIFLQVRGVVSRLARQNGYRVIANDWEPYSHALNSAISPALKHQRLKSWAAIRKPLTI